MHRLCQLGLALVFGLVLIVPSAWSVVESRMNDWRASPRFDGERYLVSEQDYVSQASDPTGASAVLATLLTWQREDIREPDVLETMTERGFEPTLASFAEQADYFGFEGQWLEASLAALPRLNTPLIAHIHSDGGRFIIVRDVRQGYVYATDPAAGNVLYPLETFDEVWTGRALVFPDPPEQPEAWR